MDDEKFLEAQRVKIAEQHAGGRHNNDAVDFERSFLAWLLCYYLAKDSNFSSMEETIVSHQVPARVDDIRVTSGETVYLFQLKSGEPVHWDGTLVQAFKDQFRIDAILKHSKKLRLVVRSPERQERLVKDRPKELENVSVVWHPGGKYPHALRSHERWRASLQKLMFWDVAGEAGYDLAAGLVLASWEIGQPNDSSIRDVWRIATSLGHGILLFRTDLRDVQKIVLEALQEIEDSSFSSIGDTLVYKTKFGETGVFPFTIGSPAWFRFAAELEPYIGKLTSIAQVHDLMWSAA